MARCKLCDRHIFWGSAKGGLCRRCEGPFRVEVRRRERHIKQALVRLQCGCEGSATIDLCQKITDHAQALARFEQKGIPTTKPAPSDLLRTAEAHRRRLIVRTPGGNPSPRRDRRGGPDVEAALRPGEERRTAPRERIECHVRVDPGGHRAIARDVSAVGIRLEISRPTPPDGPVALTLFTSEGSLHARGTVQWAHRDAPAPQGGFSLGVRYTKPDPRVRALGGRG